MTEQITRERKQRAAKGLPPCGGLRPFGYEADKVTIEPAEAALIRAAAEHVAAGGSLWQVTQAWNDTGVETTAGNPWEVSAVRRVLTSPRIAGLRAHKGEVVGPAVWPAIIDRDTHDLIVALGRSRTRERTGKADWLLSRLIVCPKCSRPLYGSSKGQYRSYVCSPGPSTGRGCGGASISAAAAEGKVTGIVDAAIVEAAPRIAAAMSKPGKNPTGELAALEERRSSLAARWGAGKMTDAEYDSARESLLAREAKLRQAAPPRRAKVDPTGLFAAWATDDVTARRTVIETLVETPMRLSPERMDNPADRLTVNLR